MASRAAREALKIMERQRAPNAKVDYGMSPSEGVAAVCEALENGAKSVRSACIELGLSRTLILLTIDNRLKKDAQDPLALRFAQAQCKIVDSALYELEDIADGTDRGEMFEDSNTLINRAKLRIDARRWNLARVMPRTLGEKFIKDDENEPTKVIIVGGLPDEE